MLSPVGRVRHTCKAWLSIMFRIPLPYLYAAVCTLPVWLHVQQTHHTSAAGLLMSSSCDATMQGLNLGALNVETDRRGFVPVNDKMQVLDSKGKTVPHLYCIGDANGKPASPAHCNLCPVWHSKRNMCNNNSHIVPVAPGCTLLSVFKVHPTASVTSRYRVDAAAHEL